MDLQPKLIELLNKRGIKTQEEIEEFLSEKPQKTYDPFLLHNMKEGVDLILSTIEKKEKICIYGDYDADGITSTCILLEILTKLTDDVSYYIPSRFQEGYGLNIDAIRKIKDAGFDLIVTVDCGSVSCEEVEYAKSIGLKILVTDHHTIADKKADCLIINPKQKECNYPCPYLAGCGVAFKLAQGIVTETNLEKSDLTKTLDFVGIGTIGDIVPLVDENRTLAKYGLRALNTAARSSVRTLIEGISLRPGYISSENVSFAIVPHLNASGRMKEARIAVELLRATEKEKILEGVKELVQCNVERKSIQEKTFQVCKERVENVYKNDNFLLIDLDGAHEGITGIVAGKIKDTFDKPTVIVTPTDEGCYKGTGRSVNGVDLYKLLKANDDLFLRFGGHSAACGFTLKAENVNILRDNLNRKMDEMVAENPNILKPTHDVDLWLTGDDFSIELVRQMEKLEPCGEGNRRPVIGFSCVPTAYTSIGKENQFRKFTAILDNGKELQCVIWNKCEEYDEILQNEEKVSIIGSLGSKEWNGRTSLQFTVEAAE